MGIRRSSAAAVFAEVFHVAPDRRRKTDSDEVQRPEDQRLDGVTVFVSDESVTLLTEEEQPQGHAASAIPVGTDAAVEQMGLASAFSAYEVQDKSCEGLRKSPCELDEGIEKLFH